MGLKRVHGLELPVADLLERPGEYRDFAISPTLTGVGTALSRLDERPVKGELRAESVMEGILVSGRLEGWANLECARCLTSFKSALNLEVCELFVAPNHEGTVDEGAYKVTGKQIHLEPMLRDAIALDLPLNPVCTEECRGLCAGCGRDLNREGSCDCMQESTDPRWAGLEELKQRLQS